MRTRTWGSLLILLVVAACSGEDPLTPTTGDGAVPDKAVAGTVLDVPDEFGTSGRGIRNWHNPRGGSMTRRTWRSAYKVERAVWRYAADNGGVFPIGVDQPNAAGRNLVAYLPGGRLLRNAFTGVRTEPRNGAAGYSGAIGYQPIHDLDGYVIGFTIDAMGMDTSETLEIEYKPD